MIGKKINQLATELAPVSTDLTIIGDPISGVSKKITLAQLGAIFSGAVSFYNDLASFPVTGDINVIYCAKDTQKLYLWSGSAYVEVFPSQALLDTYQLRSEKGNANGYASLDSGGKVPVSQLPSSIMEYKGMWNAATNTPTLANGTGDTGDVYICNVAGTVNFGAGAITFAVGDYVIYSGTIWQRSSGAVGTVTSVAASITGDAISISGSPVTTSGTLALAFSGTSSQYINGAGNLINFPTSLVTGTGTLYALTKWGFTTGNIINSNLSDTGTTIYNNNPSSGSFAVQFNGNTTTGLSYGLLINAGTNASDIALRIQNVSSTSVYFYVWGDGRVQINNIPNATTDTDRFLVSDNGVIKYRTGAELLSDIGGASATGYVPYTGATANLDLGTFTLLAAKGTFSNSGSSDTVGITHSSGSGIALNITKGGNGEGLYINKTSGSGNAATIIGTLNATTLVKSGGTSSEFLKADGSVDSTAYGTGSVTSVGLSSATSGVTIGSTPITTSGTITLAIATASGSQQGLLSSTDWTTFNNKQNALTNPVTGTGTTNYLPKFTGASTIGNSIVQDNSTHIDIGGYALFTRAGKQTIINPNVGAGNVVADFGVGSGMGLTFTTDVERMRLDASGNLGLGVSPSAWDTYKAFQIGSQGSLASVSTVVNLSQNAYWSASGHTYIATGTAAQYHINDGAFAWRTAPSGTAGNAISFTQAMTLNASGNLSIGNTNDTYKLDVSGTARFSSFVSSSTNFISVALTDSISVGTSTAENAKYNYLGHSGYWGIKTTATGFNFALDTYNGGTPKNVLTITQSGAATFSSSVTATGGVYAGDSKFFNSVQLTDSLGGTCQGFLWTDAANTLKIGTGTVAGGNVKMTILSSGNVGIGTTSAGYKLDVYGSNQYLGRFDTSDTTGGFVAFAKSGTAYGYMGSAYHIVSGPGSANDMAVASTSNLIFSTGASLTERMRITSGGDLLINTTTNSATTGAGSKFVSNGRLYQVSSYSDNTQESLSMYSTTAAAYRFYVGWGGTIYATSTSISGISDVSLKKNIRNLDKGLNSIMQLQPKKFDWVNGDSIDNMGFIAQEIEKIFPELVTEYKYNGNETKKSLKMGDLIPSMVKAIQELKAELDTLKNK